MQIGLYTLGCKLNQSESEALALAFAQSGHDVRALESGCRLYVVNTCTVTSKSEQKARRIIRKLMSDNPQAAIVVTGCYAQLEARSLADFGSRVFVVPMDRKDRLLDLPARLHEHLPTAELVREWLQGATTLPTARSRFRFDSGTGIFRSRPFLKIQDGCDNECAYCRVRIARGPSLSLEADEVLTRVRSLEQAGAAEVVLTGVNLAAYADGPRGLVELVDMLLAGTSSIRLRFGSLEPEIICGSLLSRLADERLRPHFHIPVQSGSETVLRRMRRRYRPRDVLEAIGRLREIRDDPYIAADIITGFPGESAREAAETESFVAAAGFADLHVFPFSPRPGTEAWNMRPSVPQRVAGYRAAVLRAGAAASRAAYGARMLDRPLEGVVEESSSHRLVALTENYLKLLIDPPAGDPPAPGSPCRVKVRQVTAEGLKGVLL